MATTEVLDKLFLELSQFTKATTANELELRNIIKEVYTAWSHYTTSNKYEDLMVLKMSIQYGIELVKKQEEGFGWQEVVHAEIDALLTGTGFLREGKRVDPVLVYLQVDGTYEIKKKEDV